LTPLVFAVLNVTPDSFSDGGQYLDPAAAVRRGLQAVAEGADVLDIGGESTRPSGMTYGQGPREITASEEIDRILPVIERLRAETDRPISVDTRKSEVAAAALAAGATYVNDVSGGEFDPAILRITAASGARLILMHSRGTPETMATRTQYGDLVAEVRSELAERVAAAVSAGVARDRIWVDPGLGFAKTPEQSRILLRELPALKALRLPILVGPSRKSVLGSDRPPAERLPESIAAAVLAVQGGASAVRVHDIEPTVRALRFLSLVSDGRQE
jgi:dihydropteroate synthase